MFKVDFDIDYYNLKWDYTAPASKLMLYLQEAAILHSERCGLTMDWFFETKSGWVICDWDIMLLKPVRWDSRLSVLTAPASFKGIMAQRGFTAVNSDGEEVLRAASRWVYTDRVKLRPVKVKDEMSSKYGELVPLPFDTDFKITPETDRLIAENTVTVTRRDTDTNRHANNISYLMWVTDLLTDEEYNQKRITRLKISYKQQCVMSDIIQIRLYGGENGAYYAKITREDTLLCEIYFEME